MEASLTHETFTKHAHSKFQVQADDDSQVELELVEISELKLYPRQEQFSVTFRGPLNIPFAQGVRSFKHDQMGEFELFIVPFRHDAEGLYYEAVFNRVRE